MVATLSPVPSGPPSPTSTAVVQLRKQDARAAGLARPNKAPPNARRTRQSFPPDGLLSSGARRRRLLRGDVGGSKAAGGQDDEWSSDSESSVSHSRGSSSTQPVSSAGSSSSGDDTVGAVVRRARSKRLVRGIGTFRVVSTPAAARRRFPSVASSLGLSPVRKHAPTPVSSPARGRFPSSSPFGGRSRLVSTSSALSMTPVSGSSLGGPDFSPEQPVADDGDSSFFSEQDTISFIYEPAVISDAFSKGAVVPPPAPATPLSPFAAPFVYKPLEPTPSRSKLSADKARSYHALRIVHPAEDAGRPDPLWDQAQIETTKRLQQAGLGGEPIPVMVGPESLPYARNPSGVDGSVLDSNGRLNVWTRSPDDPEPEHVDHLHFQRRPGAPNPAARVLANDDQPGSAYSRPSDYAVPCAGPRPVFKPARARPTDGPPLGCGRTPSPFPVLPSPGAPSFAPGLQFFPNAPADQPKAAPAPVWSDPTGAFSRRPSQEEYALHALLDKLQASNRNLVSPFAGPAYEGVLSPDFAVHTPAGSMFEFSSPSSAGGLSASPFSNLTSNQTSPVAHLLPGVHVPASVGSPGIQLAFDQQQQQQQQQACRRLDDMRFLACFAGYGQPLLGPAYGPVAPSASTVAPAANLERAPAEANSGPSLMPAAGCAPRVSTPHPVKPVPRHVGRRDSDLRPVDEQGPPLFPPNSARPAASTPDLHADTPSSSPGSRSDLPSLDRCDDAIFLPAGKGKGFANGGARRPGPHPCAAPRSLGRRALDSMDVAVGRERQSSVLERERLAVLASHEREAAPVAVVVVGDRMRAEARDRAVRRAEEGLAAAEALAGERSNESKAPHERRPEPKTVRRGGRSSLPAPSSSVRTGNKSDGAGKAVLTVGSLSAMFCDIDDLPQPKTAAPPRRAEQRRIVSEPVRPRRAPASKPAVQRSEKPAGTSSAGQNSRPDARHAAPAAKANPASPGPATSGPSPTSKGGRSRGGRNRKAPAASKTSPSSS